MHLFLLIFSMIRITEYVYTRLKLNNLFHIEYTLTRTIISISGTATIKQVIITVQKSCWNRYCKYDHASQENVMMCRQLHKIISNLYWHASSLF